MPIDIKQFLQAFVEESLETLEQIEKALLDLNSDKIDDETINLMFRGMHSIKGSSTIFSYNDITSFTHTIENFLELARSGSYQITHDDIENLLKSIDCLRSMFASIQNQAPIDSSVSQNMSHLFQRKSNIKQDKKDNLEKKNHNNHKKVETELSTQKTSINRSKDIGFQDDHQRAIKKNGWEIVFHPNRNIFKTKSEPLRLFDVISELGELKVEVDISGVPSLADIDPYLCFMTWKLELYGSAKKNEIEQIFQWIVNEENITIIPIKEKDESVDSSHDESHEDSQDSLRDKSDKDTAALLVPQTTSVRVNVNKIDNLINTVGEFVITKSIINQIVKDFNMNKLPDLYEALTYLEHNSRELQKSVMDIRMVPIEFVFNRLPRYVHDLAQIMGKKVELFIIGEQTELDKNIIEKLTDPLIHLVRNALDHGIEEPNVRIAKGKSPVGRIELRAYQEGSNVIIDIIDDGKGLNIDKIRDKAIKNNLIKSEKELSKEKLYDLIFKPGFSTSDEITSVSGRGVGLDIVYRNINELGGEIDIEFSEDSGSTFRLRLPLTLAIMDCQLVKLDDQIYIIPLITITEILKVDKSKVNRLDVNNMLYFFRDNYIPIVYLKRVFSIGSNEDSLDDKFLVVVEMAEQTICLVVNEVLIQQQVVIKSLEENYGEISGISGVTILGDGRVALIIDVKALIDAALNKDLIKEKYLERNTNELTVDESTHLADLSDHHEIKILSFFMADQEYGIDIREVNEIRMWESATLLPNAPSYIKGAINFRGTIIPIIDLQEKLTLGNVVFSRHTAIVVVNVMHAKKRRVIGILVDKMADTHAFERSAIIPIVEQNKALLNDVIQGLVTVNNRMITVLNTKKLFVPAIYQEITL